MSAFVHRPEEEKQLLDALKQPSAQLITIFGRDMIGKNTLLHGLFPDQMPFHVYGAGEWADDAQALRSFSYALWDISRGEEEGEERRYAQSWDEAFDSLGKLLDHPGLERSHVGGKALLLFDEIGGLASIPDTGFLKAFGRFWNEQSSKRDDFAIIICSSSPYWIVEATRRKKGIFRYPATCSIDLPPFSFQQVRELMEPYGHSWTEEQLRDLYLVFGGIPFYYRILSTSETVYGNIQELFFDRHARFKLEVCNFYPWLFGRTSHPYQEIVQSLCRSKEGMSRYELWREHRKIVKDGKLLDKELEELKLAGFIEEIPAPDGSGELRYRVCDLFTLFCYTFLAEDEYGNSPNIRRWEDLPSSPRYAEWLPYALELAKLDEE